MPVITAPYDADNWVISVYVPEPGAFILDFSQLNDLATPLGSTGGGLSDVDVRITSIEMSEGGQPDFGVYAKLSPPVLTAGIEILDFTVADINKFHVGSAIAVRYQDSPYSVFYTIFNGKITASNVQIIPGSTIAQLTIEATSLVSDYLNTQIPITKFLGANVFDAIKTAAANFGITIFSFGTGIAQFGGAGREVKTLGEWLDDPAVTELLIPFYNSGVTIVYYVGNTSDATPNRVIGSNIITDAVFDWSGADSPTGVSLTGISNPELTYQFGSDGKNSNGQTTNFTANVEMGSIAEMATLGQKLLSMNKLFQPTTITTVTANAQRKIEYDSDVSKLNNVLELTDLVNVQLDEFDYEGNSWVVGRSMNITQDDWTTTYNLWKGFTN